MRKNAETRTKPKGATRQPFAYDKTKMFEFYVAAVEVIRRDWDAFASLFANGERAAYLKKNLPELEDRFSFLLTASVYMGLVQLFDSTETFNDPAKSNLVLRRVISDLAPPVGTDERLQIEANYKAMEPTVKLMKEWRNKMGAHRSLKIALEMVDFIKTGYTSSHPLPRIPLPKVRDALERLVNITDALVSHVRGSPRPWYRPDVIHEADWIFSAIGL